MTSPTIKPKELVPGLRIDKNSATPYYYQIKQAIKALINRQELKPGDALPSETSLSEQLGVSVLVVHRAFRELASEGLLWRKRGLGTFVALPAQRVYQIDGFLFGTTEALAQSGLELSTQILAQEVIQGDAELCQKLSLPSGTKFIFIHRLDLVRQYPFAIEYLYYVYDAFPDLATMDLTNKSTYSILRDYFKAQLSEAVSEITAAAATKKEAAMLGIRPNHPVIHLTRIAYLSDGSAIEYEAATYHPELYKFVVRERR